MGNFRPVKDMNTLRGKILFTVVHMSLMYLGDKSRPGPWTEIGEMSGTVGFSFKIFQIHNFNGLYFGAFPVVV